MNYCIMILLFCQGWSIPENLGISGVDDFNPQACRIQLFSTTCLVWEADLGGNHEIFSRFGTNTTWSDTFRITNNPLHDCNPAVAYDYARNCYWCVWQRDSLDNAEIFVAKGETTNGWQTPQMLTQNPAQDELPSVVVIKDTVWVAWQRLFVDAGDSLIFANIFCRYFDGVDWSDEIALTSDSLFNLNPKFNSRYDYPIVVWEKNQDICYREYIAGNWQPVQQITSDTFPDKFPEIAVMNDPFSHTTAGVWIVWQRDSVGTWNIYSTGYDTLNIYERITSGGSDNTSPSPLWYFQFIDIRAPTCTAFSTNRNSSYDIFYYCGYYWGGGYTGYVDLSAATDIKPVMTEDGWIWILWQTDRNGEWDIYGSCVSHGAVNEGLHKDNTPAKMHFNVHPNPFRDYTQVEFEIPNVQLANAGKDLSETGQVSLLIYDVTGRLVKSFCHIVSARGWSASGSNYQLPIKWFGNTDSGDRLPPGVFFVCLKYGEFSRVEKVILLR